MKKHVIVVAMFLLPFIVNAQNIQTYKGVMKVPVDLKAICSAWEFDYSVRKIEGEYHYYENADEDRIWHGDFWIVSDRIGYKDEVLRGTYTNGKKNGEFLLQVLDGNGEPTGLGMIVNYKNGILDGVYNNVQTNRLYNTIDSGTFVGGQIKGKIMTMQVATSLTQTVAGINPSSVMRGVVGNDGMPEGVWTITSSGQGQVPIVQKRHFRNGRLIYIEERDKSTGERSICFCVFDGLAKAPNLELIRDTNINGKECVVYDGHIAILVEDNSDIKYNSQMQDGLGKYAVSCAIPSEIRAIDEEIKKQVESWDYTYSESKYQKIIKEERERYVQDSINEAKRLLEKQRQRERDESYANRSYDRFWERFMPEHLGSIYYGIYTIINTNGKIKKCEQINGVTSFSISKNETLSGHFTKQNVITSIGNVYQPSDSDAILLENDEHTLIVFIYKSGNKNFSFLIVKDEDQHLDKYGKAKAVYEIKDSALSCLDI